ncbi:hypothetical protein [Kordia sp.]|uniref:hypothetical protein n=1 Tax=Kordia sp. TaxID=1965332 RepID=UPI003B5921B2
MIKPNHTTYLRLADSVLNSLNQPYKSYTLTYEELLDRLDSDVKYETAYSNQFERFLTKGFDSTMEIDSKATLLNSVLLFLYNEELVLYSNSHIQITFKGILKTLKGFEYDYNEAKAKAKQAKNQQKFENFMKVLPVIVAIIFGVLGYILGKN